MNETSVLYRLYPVRTNCLPQVVSNIQTHPVSTNGVPKAGIKYLFKYICHQLFQLERIVSLLLQFGSSCFTTFESNILFGLVQSSQTGDQPPIVSVFLGWTVHLKFKGLGKRYWAWISIQLREKTEINKKRSGRPWFRCTYKHFPNNSVLNC